MAFSPKLDEQGADHELGRGDVLPGEQAGEVRAGLEPVLRDRGPLELVEGVEPLDDVAAGIC